MHLESIRKENRITIYRNNDAKFYKADENYKSTYPKKSTWHLGCQVPLSTRKHLMIS